MNNELKKKCQVVMLATKEASKLLLHKISPNNFWLEFIPILGDNIPSSVESDKHYNIYILSDDEITQPCYAYSKSDNKVEWLNELQIRLLRKENWLKVIATTDTSLIKKGKCNCFATTYEGCSECLELIANPSPQFIQKYIESYSKGEVIKEVMVEYELTECCLKYVENEYLKGQFICCKNKLPQLKVDKNNYITITKVKASYSREEVIELIKNWRRESGENRILTKDKFDKWIEQNL